MNKFLAGSAALLMTTTLAQAGGLDRSGQGIGAIFEDGNHAELSFGYVTPSVTGVGPNPSFTGLAGSGNVAPAYSQIGFAVKTDVNDALSFALIMDQPFGASVDYADPGYALYETAAEVTSMSFTALGRYKLNNAFSVHGGLRMLSIGGNVAVNDPTNGPGVDYAADFSNATGTGYVIGGAYEKPEIALRVALTYSSAIDVSLPTTLTTPALGPVPSTEATLPQSVNLDFQTGIAANTLLFGSIRWVDWTVTELNPFGYPANPLLSYDQDTITYSLGVGRRFSDQLSGSVAIGYEKTVGDPVTDLSPTDGYLSLQIGAAYDLGNGTEISGGVRYLMIGDATTSGAGADFSDNSAIAIGVKLSTTF
ncbi:transporter [Loktanella sp. IMCC34160]|uniref:OmpP1/FadL family transporter n=1 Tax=Loktanella sp. IMCC34160 TaxID=2510646 RepID=UPI00101C4FA8|nr:outer membrane protein transport protein [Loktanella sp. IMCC34160]RYG92090.1 transporter [Loktanella sp. IMCC34160]